MLRLPYDSSGRARISSLSIDFVWLYGKNSQQFIQASSTGSKHLAPAEYSSRRDEIKNDDRAHCKIVCCTNSLSDALNSIGCESVYNCPVLRHTELLHSERPEYAYTAHPHSHAQFRSAMLELIQCHMFICDCDYREIVDKVSETQREHDAQTQNKQAPHQKSSSHR